jgi:hypothetical protein
MFVGRKTGPRPIDRSLGGTWTTSETNNDTCRAPARMADEVIVGSGGSSLVLVRSRSIYRR